MPRTAILLGKTHDGDWHMLADPSQPLMETKKKFLEARGMKSDEEMSTILYQESDGHAIIINLRTPDAQAKLDKQHKKDNDAAAAQAKKDSKVAVADTTKNAANQKAADLRAAGIPTLMPNPPKAPPDSTPETKPVTPPAPSGEQQPPTPPTP